MDSAILDKHRAKLAAMQAAASTLNSPHQASIANSLAARMAELSAQADEALACSAVTELTTDERLKLTGRQQVKSPAQRAIEDAAAARTLPRNSPSFTAEVLPPTPTSVDAASTSGGASPSSATSRIARLPSGSALLGAANSPDKLANAIFDRVQKTTLPLSKAWNTAVVTELTSEEAAAAGLGADANGIDIATPPQNPPSPLTDVSLSRGVSWADENPTTKQLASPGLLTSALAPPTPVPNPHKLSDVALGIISSHPEGIIFYDEPCERVPYVMKRSAAAQLDGAPIGLCLQCFDCPCACKL